MRRPFLFLFLVFLSVSFLTTCGLGEHDFRKINRLATQTASYLVQITVDISDIEDPEIYIWAEDAQYDGKVLTIKNGFVGQNENSFGAAIFLEEGRFSFPFAAKVSIKKLSTKTD
ncbi:MAG: hypothetical protein Q8R34_01745 [bacterium]|nr:hypothetical protein [bacterium]